MDQGREYPEICTKGVQQLGHMVAVWEGKSELALIQTVWNDHHKPYLLPGLAAVSPHC